MRRLLAALAFVVTATVVLHPGPAGADCLALPDNALSTWEFASPGEASLWILPDGQGPALTDAMALGGSPVDMAILVTLVDPSGNIMTSFDLDEVWLHDPAGDVAFCGGSHPASALADPPGVYAFTAAPTGGGHHAVGSDALQLRVCNLPLFFSPSEHLGLNSPDIDGDLVVNLTDVSLFATDFFGTYAYRSDFVWDGVINLSDVSILAQGMGASCD